MRTALRRDLTAALKARDKVTVTALRSALAAIENAEAVPVDQKPDYSAGTEHVAGAVGMGAAEVARRELSDADVRAVVEAEVTERSTAAQEYKRLGRHDDADRLRAEADVLNRYLAG